jgi:hypothetical protein
MIAKLDQLFADNFQWAMLVLLILAILVFTEETWKPLRRLWEWLNKSPVCKKCGGTEFKLPNGWTPDISYNLLCLRNMDNMAELPFPLPKECADCGEPM